MKARVDAARVTLSKMLERREDWSEEPAKRVLLGAEVGSVAIMMMMITMMMRRRRKAVLDYPWTTRPPLITSTRPAHAESRSRLFDTAEYEAENGNKKSGGEIQARRFRHQGRTIELVLEVVIPYAGTGARGITREAW